MNHYGSQSIKLINIALICMLPLLTACGGEEKSNCSVGDLVKHLCINVAIEQAVSGSGSSGGTSMLGNDSDGTPQVISEYNEYEPNSSLNNANPMQFPVTDADTNAGIRVVAVVHDTEDISDFFVITPNRSGTYKLSIRTGNAPFTATAESAYLMVYDQSQTTIDSTPVGVDELLQLNVNLTAGLAYYVEVHGYETYSVHYAYTLTIAEAG